MLTAPLAALLLAANEAEEVVKPLEAKSIFVILAMILVVCGALLLAGFGYFSPTDD